MDLANSISNSKANLTLSELEELASEIRETLIRNKGFTMEAYIERAKSITQIELGYRFCKAICFEPKLEAYLPDEVYEVLYARCKDMKVFHFNDDDKQYIRDHGYKGTTWIAKKMYASNDTISEVARNSHVHIKTNHDAYTPDVLKFITFHADKGHKWIAEELNFSEDAIRHKMERMGIWKKEESNA